MRRRRLEPKSGSLIGCVSRNLAHCQMHEPCEAQRARSPRVNDGLAREKVGRQALVSTHRPIRRRRFRVTRHYSDPFGIAVGCAKSVCCLGSSGHLKKNSGRSLKLSIVARGTIREVSDESSALWLWPGTTGPF
jgi:hypothetical protein